MIREDAHNLITQIEASITVTTSRAEVFRRLKTLSLSDFAMLLLCMPNPAYPKLSSKLPKMADESVQKNWTGSSGVTLLQQSMDFVRAAVFGVAEINKRGLENSRVLDFGCGYGRLARLFYYFVNEDDFYGVDPWDRSIKICEQDGLTKNFSLSDYLPTSLPVGDQTFDLIYAFSVFTHLSLRATSASLKTLGKYLHDDGILLITIRPVEYWDADQNARSANRISEMKTLHRAEGFAFLPHNRAAVDGDITYGDTSMTLRWLSSNFPEFKIVKTDYSLADPYQIYIFLKKALDH